MSLSRGSFHLIHLDWELNLPRAAQTFSTAAWLQFRCSDGRSTLTAWCHRREGSRTSKKQFNSWAQRPDSIPASLQQLQLYICWTSYSYDMMSVKWEAHVCCFCTGSVTRLNKRPLSAAVTHILRKLKIWFQNQKPNLKKMQIWIRIKTVFSIKYSPPVETWLCKVCNSIFAAAVFNLDSLNVQ